MAAQCRYGQYPEGKVANIAPPNSKGSFMTAMLAGSVGWGDACIIVPMAMYRKYGDVRILEENYEMMKNWYAFLESRAETMQFSRVLITVSGASREPIQDVYAERKL